MPKRTVLITRPRAQAASLAAAVRRLGAQAVLAPSIRVAPPSSWAPLDRALRSLADIDAAVFTSANGVERFFERAGRVLEGRPRLPKRLFAIGPATAAALKRHGCSGANLPERFEGEELALHMIRKLRDMRGLRILIPRARVARDILPRLLRKAGADVRVVEAYRTVPDALGRRRLKALIGAGGSPIVTFTSPSTVQQFVAAVGESRARRFFRTAAAASIGPITSRELRAHGIRPAAEGRPYTVDGLARAIARLVREGA